MGAVHWPIIVPNFTRHAVRITHHALRAHGTLALLVIFSLRKNRFNCETSHTQNLDKIKFSNLTYPDTSVVLGLTYVDK